MRIPPRSVRRPAPARMVSAWEEASRAPSEGGRRGDAGRYARLALPRGAAEAVYFGMSESEPSRGLMSVEEYLRFENAAETKHEYVAGEVYATEGGTMRHARIVSNVAGRLLSAARGGPFQVVWAIKCRTPLDLYDAPAKMLGCMGHQHN